MINERIQEQASLYVLGILDPVEAGEFKKQLEGNPELESLVNELQESAHLFAFVAPPKYPSKNLKGKILNEIQQKKIKKTSGLVIFLQTVPWAIAACLILYCGLLLQEQTRLKQEVIVLRNRDAMSQMRIATLTSKLENAPQAVAVALWDSERHQGLLTVEKLPPPEEGQDYQLWVIDPTSKLPVSAGIFSVNQTGISQIKFKPEHSIGGVDKFAVSLERKGGAPQPQGPIVMVSSSD